jgi:putative oxygen-independent coproporphyrinogen III oxidase
MSFGVYVHVPFCASRCGYCDFNTYTATELGGGGAQASYADNAIAEIVLASKSIERDRTVSTVFFGGGTPTILPPRDLGRVLRSIDECFGLAADAEVTTEANPESVDRAGLDALRAVGFNRVSFGMQSAREHVLATLDRNHSPGGAARAVADAKAAGFEHVNIDLIYGTPGETDDDWQASLDAAVATGVDHVSAYSLIVEPATRLAARIRRGELPMPDNDVAADRYLMAEATLSASGLEWYEVSNWARSEAAQSRHNLLYWTGGDWWGVGPGAHSHLDAIRWWNVKHPSEYARRLDAGTSPMDGREVLDGVMQRTEEVMLRTRLRSGLPLLALTDAGGEAARRLAADGLVDAEELDGGRVVLTLRGRLLGDAVVRELVD